MAVPRYSSNDRGGSEARTYNYAFSLEGRAGTGAAQFAPISNRVGGCYTQTNWVEVVNTREKTVNATVSFRTTAGQPAGATTLSLSPRSQYHLNAGALLSKGLDGSVKVESSDQGALLTQSLVYFHDCGANRLQTAFAVQSRGAGQDVQSGSMNSYLGMKNELLIANATSEPVQATVSISPYGAPAIPNRSLTIGADAQTVNELNALGSPFPQDAYGVVRLDTHQRPRVVAPFLLRSRELPNGAIDFVFPTMIQ